MTFDRNTWLHYMVNSVFSIFFSEVDHKTFSKLRSFKSAVPNTQATWLQSVARLVLGREI